MEDAAPFGMVFCKGLIQMLCLDDALTEDQEHGSLWKSVDQGFGTSYSRGGQYGDFSPGIEQTDISICRSFSFGFLCGCNMLYFPDESFGKHSFQMRIFF